MAKRLEKDEERYQRHTEAIAAADADARGLYDSLASRHAAHAGAVEESGGTSALYIDDADIGTEKQGTRYAKDEKPVWQSKDGHDEGVRALNRAATAKAAARESAKS